LVSACGVTLALIQKAIQQAYVFTCLDAMQEPPTDLMRPVQLGGRLYVCGDHRDHATLDGALKSGRRAAEALIADTVQETTSNGAPSEPVTVDQTELA